MSRRPPSALASLLMLLVLCAGACTSTDEPVASGTEPFEAAVAVSSPDGALTVEIGLDDTGRPRYRVVRDHGGETEIVVADSTLGLELTLADGARRSLVAGATGIDAGPLDTVRDRFDLPTGKRRSSTLEARTRTIDIIGLGAGGSSLGLAVWVSDTAVAFRYLLEPGMIDSPARIEWERTSFAIAPGSRAWLQPHDPPTVFTPAYERLRRGEVEAGAPGVSPAGWTFPALFASERSWTLVTEADLGDGDVGSHLSGVVEDGEYFVDPAARGEGNGVGDPRPVVDPGWSSPWRIIITSADLADIVESDHVRHLSTPADTERDWSWVRPGRVSWSWWSDHDSSQNPESIEPFVDLAAELGWEYSLVDANWDRFGDGGLAGLVDDAAERNVGLFLWYNSGGGHNVVTEAPRDLMADGETRRAEFARIAELGIRGVKVDFFHSDKPDRIQQYRDILRDAADFELLVNFHGSTMPRGWAREFPNLMTMEAVAGAEFYTFSDTYAAAAPAQNTVLPFTRNVVGSMDYTPVLLGDTEPRRSRGGHELALAVVFESGLQHLADTPDAYLSQPEPIVDLLAELPTVWDETRFLDGEPGSHIAVARRHGDSWWIGAINGTDESLTVVVDAARLGLDPTAPVTRVCDEPAWDFTPGLATTWADPAQWRIGTGRIGTDLSALELVPFGGCLIRVGP